MKERGTALGLKLEVGWLFIWGFLVGKADGFSESAIVEESVKGRGLWKVEEFIVAAWKNSLEWIWSLRSR